jgi:hypothetical protein
MCITEPYDMTLLDGSLNPEYYSLLHSTYHICLTVRLDLVEI